jgi:hypothetical protein
LRDNDPGQTGWPQEGDGRLQAWGQTTGEAVKVGLLFGGRPMGAALFEFASDHVHHEGSLAADEANVVVGALVGAVTKA